MVDFFYYKENFFGNMLSEYDFLSFCKKAEAYVKYYVGPKFCECDEIKNAICAVCEVLFKYEERDGVVSEANDGISKSFSPMDISKKSDEVIKIYLSQTNLLYRGM
ncbi:MAG: hypothetical protein E7404_05720 [Ruminococcaceae bacterium]|nr:hypothetical protein [Oscillospiraceae bacterium]